MFVADRIDEVLHVIVAFARVGTQYLQVATWFRFIDLSKLPLVSSSSNISDANITSPVSVLRNSGARKTHPPLRSEALRGPPGPYVWAARRAPSELLHYFN